jgi:hypothetical protein
LECNTICNRPSFTDARCRFVLLLLDEASVTGHPDTSNDVPDDDDDDDDDARRMEGGPSTLRARQGAEGRGLCNASRSQRRNNPRSILACFSQAAEELRSEGEDSDARLEGLGINRQRVNGWSTGREKN